jgi:hypothetical protein
MEILISFFLWGGAKTDKFGNAFALPLNFYFIFKNTFSTSSSKEKP